MVSHGNPYADSEYDSVDSLSMFTELQGDWRLFKVSALYNLEYSIVKLKQYASKIKHALSSTVTANTPLRYRVHVDAEPDLRKNQEDPYALCIKVLTLTGNGSVTEHLSYSTILMCWGERSEVPKGTHLPYLLERGRQQIGDTVKMMLTKLFDCCIMPVHFNKSDMMLFTIDFCRDEPAQGTKSVKFVFKPPSFPKSKITLTIGIQKILYIYNRINEEEEEMTQETLVERMYVSLQRHIFLNVGIDISVLELTKVSHPRASVSDVGTIGIQSTLTVRSVLDKFNKLLFVH